MNRRTVALVASCLVATGTLVLALHAQEQSDRPRDRQPRSSAPVIRATAVPSGQTPRTPPPTSPDKPAQPTRLQIDVFELAGTNETLATLNLDNVTSKDPAPAEVLARLAALGKTRLLARIDSTIDLASPSSVTQSQRVPIVQDMNVSKEGKATPSVTYQNIGLTAEIHGRWLADKTDRAEYSYKLELSNMTSSAVEVAKGVNLPVFVTLSANASTVAASGVPMWAMASSLPAVNDDKATTVVTLVRLVVTRPNQ